MFERHALCSVWGMYEALYAACREPYIPYSFHKREGRHVLFDSHTTLVYVGSVREHEKSAWRGQGVK